MAPEGLAERFWEKVDVRGEDECWNWQGGLNDNGYGRFRVDGQTEALAHRVSYALHAGADPGDMMVRHSCDNPRCVNPRHLSLGTNTDNMRDASARRRLANQKVTHCPRGHEYTEENTHVDVKGRRECRICRRTAARNAYLRRAGYDDAAIERIQGRDRKNA